ncbi:MAG: hypothetical protein L7U57_04425, partial [Glaciecola sp.]|nr:hypothetical protein [Glaciecola sp.]
MKINLLNVVLVVVTLGLTNVAQANIIPLEDWWLQEDNSGGLRQNIDSPDMFFAVAKTPTWQPNAIYEVMDGYHWASFVEASAMLTSNSQSTKVFTYYNQEGWSGYNFQGINRYFFRYSDSQINGHYKHAGNYVNH